MPPSVAAGNGRREASRRSTVVAARMVPSRLLALAAPLLGLFAAAAAVGQEKGQDIGQDNGRKNGVGGAAGTGGLVGRSSPLQVVEPDDDDKDLRTTPVVRAVQRAADSVVSIYLQNSSLPANGGGRAEPRTEGQGSGVILDESGLVITNWHVIAPVVLGNRGAAELGVEVRLRDGRARPARVLSSSAKRDLALLQIRREKDDAFKPAEIGRSDSLMVGETVIAIGNPQGQANTVTSGVLSAIDRSIRVRTPDGELREYTGLLQTDAAINQGNSGGALLDITGRLVGINNAMAMGAENIGFAIPMDMVRGEFQRELLQSNSFAAADDAAWLGLEVLDRDGAVVIGKVVADGPAARAGARAGDLLARVGDTDIRSSLDYLRCVFDARADAPLPLLLRRGGRDVRADAKPMTRGQWQLQSAIGAMAAQVDGDDDRELVRKATLAFYRGSGMRRVPMFPAIVRLDGIAEDGPAAAIGLKAGDVVLSVFVRQAFGERELPVTSLRDFVRLLDANRGRSLKLSVLRGDDDLVGTIDVRR
jgi:serine protease Do